MAKDNNPKKTATRGEKQRRRLRPNPACNGCGESDPAVLEQHHVMGRAHDPKLTIILCRNCHKKATEGQLREGVPLGATTSFPDCLAAMLAGLAAFFRFLADAFDRLVEQVKDFAGSHDAKLAGGHAALSEGS
jgi:hypothetical protein